MMNSVSIIVPCYNEERTIGLLLQALYDQTYPREQLEVVISDGLSTDETRARIHDFKKNHPDLVVNIVDNTVGTIPAALNQAIAAAKGEIIVRLDAHSVPQPDYVACCAAALEQGKGENVGGVWQIEAGGEGWMAAAIAAAAAHPLGVGDAKYRYTAEAQQVDTVPFGAFRKSLVGRIGGFDESLLANEDYEFNTRVRQAGGTVWLDPAIRSVYFARAALPALAKQYWRYGFWKARMLRRYPRTLRWRQALPPLFVLVLAGLLLAALFLPALWWQFAAAVVSYALVLLLVGVQAAWKARKASRLIGVPLAVATMHLSWGSAFLWSLIAR